MHDADIRVVDLFLLTVMRRSMVEGCSGINILKWTKNISAVFKKSFTTLLKVFIFSPTTFLSYRGELAIKLAVWPMLPLTLKLSAPVKIGVWQASVQTVELINGAPYTVPSETPKHARRPEDLAMITSDSFNLGRVPRLTAAEGGVRWKGDGGEGSGVQSWSGDRAFMGK